MFSFINSKSILNVFKSFFRINKSSKIFWFFNWWSLIAFSLISLLVICFLNLLSNSSMFSLYFFIKLSVSLIIPSIFDSSICSLSSLIFFSIDFNSFEIKLKLSDLSNNPFVSNFSLSSIIDFSNCESLILSSSAIFIVFWYLSWFWMDSILFLFLLRIDLFVRSLVSFSNSMSSLVCIIFFNRFSFSFSLRISLCMFFFKESTFISFITIVL